MLISLPEVTVIALDCVAHDLTQAALRDTLSQITPGDIQVWGGDVSNWVPADPGSTWGTPGAVSPYAGWQAGQQNLWYSPITNAWGTPGKGNRENTGTPISRTLASHSAAPGAPW